MPLDLTANEYSWPIEWKPQGWNTSEAESFDAWWNRTGGAFLGLDPRVLQQWMHRHWEYSDYWGLPIINIKSSLERWSTESILSSVGTPSLADSNRGSPSPAEEYKHLNEISGRCEPMLSMNATGTWNFPLLLHQSPDGFVYKGRTFEAWKYWLIEGHLRLRYLRAIAHFGSSARDHEVLVLYRTTSSE